MPVVHLPNAMTMAAFLLGIVTIWTVFLSNAHAAEEVEFSPQDGWFNNLIHPDWGAVDSMLLRRSKTSYSDGVYHMAGKTRPNPFKISEIAHHGPQGQASLRNRTAMLVFFGQQTVEEILDAQRPGCPREYENIPVPKDHILNPQKKDDLEMPFLRSRYDARTGQSPNNPRQQLNEITPYIDGGLMYGPAKTWTDAIREFKGGRLKARDPTKPIKESFPADNDINLPFANPPAPRDHKLRPVSRFFRLGNPRGNENPMMLSFHILFFRLHNYIAEELSKNESYRNDEEIFNEARRRVIAYHQKIVLYDWLPLFLQIKNEKDTNVTTPSIVPEYTHDGTNCGNLCRFNGYDPNIHPGIATEFQSAAMRFGHTLVTPGLWLRGPGTGSTCNFEQLDLNIPSAPGKVHALRLCNSFWTAQEIITDRFEQLLRGMTSTLAEREDRIMVPDIRTNVFGTLDFSRRDLAALNIQRGRDHGLPGYNDVREAYGLPRRKSWEEINNDTTDGTLSGVLMQLKQLYGNTSAPDELDLFPGGLLETTPDGPGELFRAILLDQFLRIRHGDRFWFENTSPQGPGFSEDFINFVRTNVTLKDIIVNVTSISPDELPDNVFIADETAPCVQRDQYQLKADSNQKVKFGSAPEIPVFENCTTVKYYDYFSGSEVSFPLTFLFLSLCVPATIGVMLIMAKRRQKMIAEARRKMVRKRSRKADPNTFEAVEWVGPQDGERAVKLVFDRERRKLHVYDTRKKPLRMLDLRRLADNQSKQSKVHLRMANDNNLDVMSVRIPNEIDLVLRFSDADDMKKFRDNLEEFLRGLNIDRDVHFFSEKTILSEAETKEKRRDALKMFMKFVCVQAFRTSSAEMGIKGLSDGQMNTVKNMQLNRTEFADSLGLKPNSIFVRNMFLLVDKDKSGTVGFTEFLDMFVVLSTGDADSKAHLIFSMYDLNNKGYLTRNDFQKMIESLMDMSEQTVEKSDINELVDVMFSKAGLQKGENVDHAAFKRIFADEDNKRTLESATLQLEGISANKGKRFTDRRKTFIMSYRGTGEGEDTKGSGGSKIKITAKKNTYPTTPLGIKLFEVLKFIENNRLQIFWVTLYTLVTLGIFVERAIYYSFEREHVGLRRIAGYGVTVTRGAASVMMFTYAGLLVTMSRNVITFLRETFLHRIIPFDSAHSFHKYIAALALVATVVHCIGHGINLYHISTQASNDLNCIFREYFRATHILASFHYWAFTTITGITGIILTLIVIIIYVFAVQYARRNVFTAFWFTHNVGYVLLYIFLVLHGSGRLVQPPLFQNYFYGPLVVFVFDKLISLSRKKRLIDVLKADLLPSEVIALKFKRPLDFDYKSGQWVRIACLKLGGGEYHPFTLTSAPHEDFLSLHIRAVGPWTLNLRNVYDPNNIEGNIAPKLYLDGPFGEGHQDWYKYEIAVLVGGGIGVTPFASILKDIVYQSKYPACRIFCKKVYFLWVTRTQKQFEWLTDIIREVEKNDAKCLVTTHIFITQFQQKYDLRTTMLYICERHFQKVAGKSLFTGLRSTTHFGRPQFQQFFMSLKEEHPKVNNIGVFSCGPPPMTLQVDKACATLNKYQGYPTYTHHFENF